MRTLKILKWAQAAGLVWGLVLCLNTSVLAQEILNPQSKLWLEGNSTLHPFSITANRVELFVKVTTGQISTALSPMDWVEKKLVGDFMISIPVAELKSFDPAMDLNMRTALKAEHFDAIQYTVKSYELLRDADGKDPHRVYTKGVLRVAGVDRAVAVDAAILPVSNGFRVTGDYEILMRDYGVEPPSFFFIFNVENQIRVRFDMQIEKSQGGLYEK